MDLLAHAADVVQAIDRLLQLEGARSKPSARRSSLFNDSFQRVSRWLMPSVNAIWPGARISRSVRHETAPFLSYHEKKMHFVLGTSFNHLTPGTRMIIYFDVLDLNLTKMTISTVLHMEMIRTPVSAMEYHGVKFTFMDEDCDELILYKSPELLNLAMLYNTMNPDDEGTLVDPVTGASMRV